MYIRVKNIRYLLIFEKKHYFSTENSEMELFYYFLIQKTFMK